MVKILNILSEIFIQPYIVHWHYIHSTSVKNDCKFF